MVVSEKLAGSRSYRTLYIIYKELGYYSEVVCKNIGGFSVRELHVLVYILKEQWLICGDKL